MDAAHVDVLVVPMLRWTLHTWIVLPYLCLNALTLELSSWDEALVLAVVS